MIRICILIGFFIFSLSANAALFGASSYEECMNDGKVGRTVQEMQVLSQKCKKSFPSLPSVRDGNNKKVVCTFNGQNWTFNLSVNKKNNTAKVYENTTTKVTSFTDKNVYLTWKTEDSKNVYMAVNFVGGTFHISKDGEAADYGSCAEMR